jgi:3-phenylpropionate/trans-cinnamate dioxygenase ferredoxin reductase subunit
VLVDQYLVTSDPSISAIGDCVRFPDPLGTPIRLESVQNAVGQAKRFAANIVHGRAPYKDLPWFWSDQGALRLQMVGLTHDADTAISTKPTPDALVVQAFRNGVLVGVEAMNAPAQYVRARRVLSESAQISLETARSLDWSLDKYLELVRPTAVS